jgi:hypothetical protein
MNGHRRCCVDRHILVYVPHKTGGSSSDHRLIRNAELFERIHLFAVNRLDPIAIPSCSNRPGADAIRETQCDSSRPDDPITAAF